MSIEVDKTVLILSLVFGVPGFIIISSQTSILTAIGVTLIAIATGIRRK